MSNRIVGVAGAVLAAAGLVGMAGCDVVQPSHALPADAFVTNHATVGQEAGQGTDHSGQLNYESQHRPAPEIVEKEHISKVVRESVKPLTSDGSDAETHGDFPPGDPGIISAPSSTTRQSRGVSTGQFEWVGSVLATVNGEPIYADKVLSTLERPLKAEAQADNEQHFRSVAEDLLSKQVREFIDNDLEYAAAKMALEKKDEQIARYITGEWRKDQVRKAGGSEALAKQHAAEEGIDFEELARQQLRLNITRLYYQNKIFPQIKISAQDMRNYYQANIRQFQQPTSAKFRVIFISAEKNGGRDGALKKAEAIIERAKKGDDFAKMAGSAEVNDDPNLARKSGAVGDEKGWMEKGAYVVEKVESAVWELHPGDISLPIDTPDRHENGFWLAKLEEVHNGASEPFESQKVQDTIRDVLRREQFAKLREMHRRKLVEQAVIYENPDVRQVMTEMVMQRYKLWTSGK